MDEDDTAFLSTPRQRVLFAVGMFGAVVVASGVFAGLVSVVTLRVAGFHELDPAGTAMRIGAAVSAWELVKGLLWAAWRWRGSAGLGTYLRTGRPAKRKEHGRWFRVLRWTRDTVAVAAVVGILPLRFPDDASAWWAAAEVLVAIKGIAAAIVWSLAAMDNAFNRRRERWQRAQPPSNPNLVPVEDILSRPDITGPHPYEPRHTAD